MAALGHLMVVDTVHCVDCKLHCIAATGLAGGFDPEIRSMCLGLWALVLCADTEFLVGKDTLADMTVGIAGTEMTAAIVAGEMIGLRAG